jgi:hypothetical protein
MAGPLRRAPPAAGTTQARTALYVLSARLRKATPLGTRGADRGFRLGGPRSRAAATHGRSSARRGDVSKFHSRARSWPAPGARSCPPRALRSPAMASNHEMNPEKFRNTFQAINHGTVMEAAARNLKKEMMRDADAAAKRAEGASRAVIDMQDLEQARTPQTPHALERLTGCARACHARSRRSLAAARAAGRGAGADSSRPHRADEGAPPLGAPRFRGRCDACAAYSAHAVRPRPAARGGEARCDEHEGPRFVRGRERGRVPARRHRQQPLRGSLLSQRV